MDTYESPIDITDGISEKQPHFRKPPAFLSQEQLPGPDAGADEATPEHSDADPLSAPRDFGLNIDVIASVPRFIGRIFSVDVQDVILPDGRKSTREVVRHPGGSSIVAVDDQGKILLVRQHRVGSGGLMREIPAGKLDPPEDALTCARRELSEEAGLAADRWELLTRFCPSPGYTDEVISVYLARDLIYGKAAPDEGEWLTREWLPLSRALQEVKDGTLCDGKTCIGILLAADRLGIR